MTSEEESGSWISPRMFMKATGTAWKMNCRADDYDRLIQLCDSLAVDYGFVILEKRFVDVTRRYGIMEGYIKGWDTAFAIKEDFEKDMGCSIYDVLPDVGKTSLLTPKPWKPGNRP